MKIVQRASAWVGWTLLAAVGVLAMLEATSAIDQTWRSRTADGLDWLLSPSLSSWAVALIGAALTVVAVVLLIAQLVPIRHTLRPLHVESPGPGSTTLNATALYHSIGQAIKQIDGVDQATPIPHRRRLAFQVGLTDGTNASAVAAEAITRLDDAFWQSLGVDARPVRITMTYGKTAT